MGYERSTNEESENLRLKYKWWYMVEGPAAIYYI